jgi:hypothetical protein
MAESDHRQVAFNQEGITTNPRRAVAVPFVIDITVILTAIGTFLLQLAVFVIIEGIEHAKHRRRRTRKLLAMARQFAPPGPVQRGRHRMRPETLRRHLGYAA